MKQLCLLSASVVFAWQAYGQTKNLTAAKPGDFVFPERKYTYVELDNGTYDVWFRNALLYVDSVSRNNDSSLSAVHITNGYLFSFTVHFDDSEQNNYEEITTGRSTGIFICDTCSREGAYIPYICNDSTAFYSTHPSKPFRYGWAFSRAKSEELNREAFFYDFHPHEKVLSIGASSGWYEGMLSVFTDSVEFTIQDIFPLVINEREMAGVVNYYSSIRDSPQTNTFKMVVGTADHTGLSEGELYDKIMIKNAYHEFTKKWSMLHQLKQHLKPDGKLILTGELFSNKYYTNIHPGCEIRSSRTAVVIDFFAQQGLYPVWLHYPVNSFDNDLIFSLDKAASDAYMKKISRCDSIILQLDLLYNASYAKNPVYMQKVEKSLLQNMTTLLENYDTLDVYLSDIGSVWNERGRYELAVQILELSNRVFPDKSYTLVCLGESYLWLNETEKAENCFNAALQLDPESKEDIDFVKEEFAEGGRNE